MKRKIKELCLSHLKEGKSLNKSLRLCEQEQKNTISNYYFMVTLSSSMFVGLSLILAQVQNVLLVMGCVMGTVAVSTTGFLIKDSKNKLSPRDLLESLTEEEKSELIPLIELNDKRELLRKESEHPEAFIKRYFDNCSEEALMLLDYGRRNKGEDYLIKLVEKDSEEHKYMKKKLPLLEYKL